ncbi:putative zinc finger protein [Nemania abortiva]|nr:putative zinc finger protein [Nemania abortiva]
MFDELLKDFKQNLGRREVEDFKKTTLEELRVRIGDLQARQHTQRRLQDLNRLEPFLNAIEQFGGVVSIFYTNDDITAFVWGPVKLLLQATSEVSSAFCELLNAYKDMGESLPLLSQYQDLFHAEPHLILVLSQMYEDILKFHRIILRYFQRSRHSFVITNYPVEWQQLFSETWTACKSRLSNIIHSINQRRSLIESQATPSQIEEVRGNIQQSRQIEDHELDEQNLRRIKAVHNWLSATNVDTDQDNYTKTRAEYPTTGQWLLGNTLFQEWFNPRFPTIPPLLWLNGIPGAGKTILASFVVEKARKLSPAPTVLFFYCKYDNSERDNFVALGRSLLSQFLKQDNGLLPVFYQKSCRSGEAVLTSRELVEELLNLAFKNCKSAYIILDGLDECPRDQRKYITQWFRRLVEDLPKNEPERLRCLFVSQDDGPARKDFAELASIKIGVEDNRNDIEEYSRIEANKLRESCPSLTEEKANEIAENVANVAEGLFLLAKLIWINLSGHTSIARLDEELEPGVFPSKINDAYRRIMVRMAKEASPVAMDDILRLLGWLVCVKRPLKWYEVQGMNSINLDRRWVATERQSFMKSPKDLCASLVEIRSDGTLEFVHLTAKFFLLEENYVNAPAEELKLATLCIDYLNLPTCVRSLAINEDYKPTQEQVLNGDYAFMDYAVIYWLRHLEAGVTLGTEGSGNYLEQLAESLEIFIGHHWTSPKAALSLAKRHSEKLQFFRASSSYDRLEKVVASTRKQLKFFGNMKKDEIALDLSDIVANVRSVLEEIASGAMNTAVQQMVNKRYGDNLFKCPRFSCQFFTEGFSSAAERQKHIGKHERPFQCSEENCAWYTFGFASEPEREKHVRESHFTTAIQDEEGYPTDQDVDRSILNSHPVPVEDHSMGDVGAVANQDHESDPEPESEHEIQQLPRQKRPRQTEFECPHCHIVYKKRYNLQSHLRTHVTEQSHVCDFCGKAFARSSDHTRHLKTHTGVKEHVCHGFLANGNPWGCGKSFARAETLRKHHESRLGQSCIRPLLQQQQQQQQQQHQQGEYRS